jgi:PTS system N-acetylglucosamine-specific IIC component
MKNYLQRMGRSLQLPVAVLPAAALLVGVGHYLPRKWFLAQFLQAGGTAILNQLALLFAVGLALGMVKDKSGAVALAAVVAYYVPVSILAPANVALLKGIKASQVNQAFNAISGNVFIGIVAGLIAAALYNRFHSTQLPMALSFFSGKRMIPILAALVMLVFTLILLVVWPALYGALVAFGKLFVNLGAVGAGLYGFFNRLLIPTGLHQALNQVFWFNTAGINDIGKFWANEGVKGITGRYQAGFFPVMMFGLPAGALAIYRNALPARKKETAGLMMAGAFAAFFTGVTEPLEFSFMFVAWPLYLLHAVFTGLSLAFAAFMHWTAGFTFSAGLVDFVLSAHLPIANQPLMLLVQGVVMAVIYYFGFDFAIKKFNLMTPGREPVTAAAPVATTTTGQDKYQIKAQQLYQALGGAANLTVVDNCTTRLRLQLKDTDKIDQNAIKAAGVAGLNVISKTNLQIIIGTDVQFVADALSALKEQNAPLQTVTPVSAPTSTEPATTGQIATEALVSPANGNLLPIEQVADSTFAQKMLGDGFAVEPSEGTIVAPVDGVITTVFPTKHAIGITTPAGVEVLVHIGINTVELEGTPFEVMVKADQKVQAGDTLVKANLMAIQAAGKATTTMVILTNMAVIDHTTLAQVHPQTIKAGYQVATLTTK